MENNGAHSPPKITQHITELSDDEDEDPAPRPKRPNCAGRKKSRRNTTIVDSSSNDQVSKKGKPAVTSKNIMDIDSSSDDEQVKIKPITKKASKVAAIDDLKESSEDELGEL
jgi:hypothetical protein